MACLDRDQHHRQPISQLLETHPWIKMHENNPELLKEVNPEYSAKLERENYENNLQKFQTNAH